VPQQVALTGFDNWDVMTLASRPPLTSVDMDLEGLGRAAASLLLEAIDGHPSPGVHTHPPKLVIRDSTAAAVGQRPS
jgi:LacI family transcriptional regulator